MKKAITGLCVALGMTGWLQAQDGIPAARLGSPKATLGRPGTHPATERIPELPIQQTLVLEGKPPELPMPLQSGPSLGALETGLPPLPELPPALMNGASNSIAKPIPIRSTSTTGTMNAAVVDSGSAPMPTGSTAPNSTTPYTVTPGRMMPYYPAGTVVQTDPSQPQMGMPQMGTVGTVVTGPTGICTDMGTCVDTGHGWLGLHGAPYVLDRNCIYGSAEYLRFKTKSANVPALVTTGPAGNSFGIVGQPGTSSLLSSNSVFPDTRSGGRVGMGIWLGSEKRCAIDVAFLVLSQQNRTSLFASDGTMVLARPFASASFGRENSEIVAAPGISSGSIGVSSSSQFWSGEANFRKKWIETPRYTVDWLIGYRHLNLHESLTVTERVSGAAGSQFEGVNGSIADSFRTGNEFNGGQIGTIFEIRQGRWSLGASTKFAVGVNSIKTDIGGGTTQTGPVFIPVSTPGGLLALNSNIGAHTSTPVSYASDVGLNLGYSLTTHWKLTLGYNAIYWTNVQRPGDAINRTIDESRAPILNTQTGLPAVSGVYPSYMSHNSSYWAQGVTVGMVLTW